MHSACRNKLKCKVRKAGADNKMKHNTNVLINRMGIEYKKKQFGYRLTKLAMDMSMYKYIYQIKNTVPCARITNMNH